MGSAREVFDRGTKAFNDHNIEGVMDLYTDDSRFEGPGGMVFKGKDQIREFLKGWYQGFPDCKTTSSNVLEIGDVIVEEGIFSGTHTGVFPTPMGDIPPTGKKVEGKYVDVYEIRNGKVMADRLLFDRMDLMEQLGLVPAAAAAR